MKKLLYILGLRVLPLAGLCAAVLLTHTLVVYSKEEKEIKIEDGITLKTVENQENLIWEYTKEKPWYSKNVYGADLKLEANITSNIKPENIRLTTNGEVVNGAVITSTWKEEQEEIEADKSDENETKDAQNGEEQEGQVKVEYLINADTEQNQSYALEYEIEGENFYKEIPVMIDNSQPPSQAQIELSEESKERIIDMSKYEGHTEENALYTKDEVTLEFQIQDLNSNGSDLSEIIVTSQIENKIYGMISEDTVIKLEKTTDEGGNLLYNSSIKLPVNGVAEQRQQITNIKVRDLAGNESEIEKELYETVYFQDNQAPGITFFDMVMAQPKENKAHDNTAQLSGRTVGDVIYTRDNITGKINVEDAGIMLPEAFWLYNGDKEMSQEEDYSYKGENTFEYRLLKEGEYQLRAMAIDMCGNESAMVDGPYVVIDRTAPEIEISYRAVGDKGFFNPAGEDMTYVNAPVTVHVEVRDTNIKAEDIALSIISEKAELSEQVLFVETENGYEANIELSQDASYSIEIKADDLALNSTIYQGKGFTIDATAPKVKIEFDNNDHKNEKYYSKSRKALITVEDMTFDENSSELVLENSEGTDLKGIWVKENEEQYTMTIPFENDGTYSIKFRAVDKAGNRAAELNVPEFVIDKKAPVINVRYDNSIYVNEKYYNKARMATITIVDNSLDGTGIRIKSTGESRINENLIINNFAKEAEDTYVAKILFEEDGSYAYEIEAEDLAGNMAEPYLQQEFIIDTTKPSLEFTGAADHSANNGPVEAGVKYGDANVDLSRTLVSIHGVKNGDINLPVNLSGENGLYTLTYSDFPVKKEYDDLYILEAKIYDLAGNETISHITFSVNRFGSVFGIDEETRTLLEKYYLNKAQAVTLMEVNVDDVIQRELAVTRDGKSLKLKEGRDYNVYRQGSDENWKAYYYTISPDFFKKDGEYQITLFTKDRANNEADSGTSGQNIRFALDREEPSIAVSGLKEGKTYYEKEHEIAINVTDNMNLSQVSIFVDGREEKSYSEEELLETNGDLKYKIPKSKKVRTIAIKATDLAANCNEKVFGDVVVNPEREGVQRVEHGTNEDFDNTAMLIIGILIVAVIGSALIGVRKVNG